MNQDEVKEIWHLEEQFWLADSAFFERTLAPNALMVLPEPAGVLDRAATIDSIRYAARWQHVSFKKRHHALSGSETVVLAYLVLADRGPSDTSYAAQCSSTYVSDNGQWLLLLHHQTRVSPHSGVAAAPNRSFKPGAME